MNFDPHVEGLSHFGKDPYLGLDLGLEGNDVSLGVHCGECHLVFVEFLCDGGHTPSVQNARIVPALSPGRKLELGRVPKVLYFFQLELDLQLFVGGISDVHYIFGIF